MNNHVEHTRDFEEIVREARMQRSVALAAAIAGMVGAISVGVRRLVTAMTTRGAGAASVSARHS
ncbi:MAG: hypothetical protein ABI854_02575 [Betaproteobacteria bacterium]